MALYQAYINSIQSMLFETTDVKQLNFKSDELYRQILEHCTVDYGICFYNLIKQEFPHAVITKFTDLNDMYGGPVKSQIFELFTSPASLLYIYHAHLILKHLSNIKKDEVDFVEVGAGYGGLCLALHIYAPDFGIKIKSYTIIDLLEPLKLQELYLNAHGINPEFINACTYGQHAKTDVYFISIYAISEFDKEVFENYRNILIPKCAHGFIIWNYMNHFIPSDLLNASKFNITYEEERPQTSRHNQIITFSRYGNIYVKERYIKDLVSVVIPTYERFECVKVAITSVLSQTYKPIEIIVVNDCSKDERYKTLQELFPTVIVIHLPFNVKQKYGYLAPQGEVRARGAAISKGEFLAFLDDDDAYCDKQKIEMQVNLMKKYPDHKLCSSEMINGHGTFKGVNVGVLHLNLPNGIGNCLEKDVYSIDKHLMNTWDYVLNSTSIVDHKLYDFTGGMRAENYEDYECWKRVAHFTNIIFINKPLVYYDINHGGATYYRYT